MNHGPQRALSIRLGFNDRVEYRQWLNHTPIEFSQLEIQISIKIGYYIETIVGFNLK
jgi:hypothetical protein